MDIQVRVKKEVITDYCKENGLSVGKLFEEIGVDVSAFHKWSDTISPKINTLAKVAVRIGKSLDELIEIKNGTAVVAVSTASVTADSTVDTTDALLDTVTVGDSFDDKVKDFKDSLAEKRRMGLNFEEKEMQEILEKMLKELPHVRFMWKVNNDSYLLLNDASDYDDVDVMDDVANEARQHVKIDFHVIKDTRGDIEDGVDVKYTLRYRRKVHTEVHKFIG